MTMIKTAIITIGGSLLAGKIARNTANDPKAAIGSGTAPSLQPGGDIQITPVEGSDVQDFGNFENQNIAMSDEMTEQEQLLLMLQEAGMGPDGLASMAFGGQVQYKDNGGGILNILDPNNLKQMEEIKAMIAQLSGRPPEAGTRPDLGVDFESGVMETESLEDIMENQIVNNDTTRTEILAGTEPDYNQEIGDQTTFDEIGYYAQENPELAKAGLGALTQVISTIMTDPPEQPTSAVRTQTTCWKFST
jgi:hypothetical protein